MNNYVYYGNFFQLMNKFLRITGISFNIDKQKLP